MSGNHDSVSRATMSGGMTNVQNTRKTRLPRSGATHTITYLITYLIKQYVRFDINTGYKDHIVNITKCQRYHYNRN